MNGPKQLKISILSSRGRLSDIAKARGLKSWPSSDDLNALVVLANGLFIFAATAVKFLSHKGFFGPKEQLATLLCSKSLIYKSLHKHLDVLYLQVFSNMTDTLKDRIQKYACIEQTTFLGRQPGDFSSSGNIFAGYTRNIV